MQISSDALPRSNYSRTRIKGTRIKDTRIKETRIEETFGHKKRFHSATFRHLGKTNFLC